MSVPFSGVFTRSGGVVAAIAKQIKLLNFKGVKRITVEFDPFHEKATPTRDFLHHVSSQRVSSTNPNCVIKANVVCDRSNPSVDFQFIPAVQSSANLKNIRIDCENLTLLEILQITNKHITVLAPKEEAVSTLKTKSEKKAGGVRRK